MSNKVDVKVEPSENNIVKSVVISTIFACIGYFVYGGIEGFIAVFAISFIVPAFISICSLIPVFGLIGSALIAYYWLLPGLFNLTGIYWTWLIAAIFGISILWGFIVTAVMVAMVASIIG